MIIKNYKYDYSSGRICFQEAEMIEAFVDFQNDLLLYGIGFELRNEVQ